MNAAWRHSLVFTVLFSFEGLNYGCRNKVPIQRQKLGAHVVLTEILRKIVLITLWLVSGSASLLIFVNLFLDTYRGKEELEFEMLLSGVLIIVGAYVCHRIINWQIIKREKNAPPE